MGEKLLPRALIKVLANQHIFYSFVLDNQAFYPLLSVDGYSFLNDTDGIKNRLKISKWKKKGIVSFDNSVINSNLKAALILPDGNENSPAYLVFPNYEKILKWNRSLRFAISVCTLSNKIKL